MEIKIKSICKDLSAKIESSNGGTRIDFTKLQGRLLSDNGIEPHNLEFHDLCVFGSETSIRGLTEGAVFTDLDHYLFWSWSAALLTGPKPDAGGVPDKLRADGDVTQLMRTVARCLLPEQGDQSHWSVGEGDILDQRHRISAYLGFSLLEAICLKLCVEFVQPDGTIIKEFTLNRKNHRPPNRCSNLGTLLSLAIKETKNDDLKATIQRIVEHLAKIAKCKYGSSFLFQLRNESLHRGISHQAMGGTLLSISILLAFQIIEENFTHYKGWALVNSHYAKERPLPRWTFESDYAALSKTNIPIPDDF